MGRRDLWAWVWPGCVQHSGSCGLQYGRNGGEFSRFTSFTSTKVQILTPEELRVRGQVLHLLALLVQKYKYWHLRSCVPKGPGTQFTCFASTQVQIQTPEELRAGTQFTYILRPCLSLLALLVQKYKYWHLRSCVAEQITEYLQYILRPRLSRYRYRLRLPAGLYMCPHTAVYCYICVLILLYVRGVA